MIVFDENVHQQRIMASVAVWYCGCVLSVTALRPGTLIADEAIPTTLRRVSQPTFVTTPDQSGAACGAVSSPFPEDMPDQEISMRIYTSLS